MLIHIGYHKTATTWLQEHIFDNPAKGFMSRWSVSSGEAIEHFVLQHPMRYDPQAVRNAFRDSYGETPGRYPVISHEDLSGYPIFGRYYGFDVCERIHRAFPDAKILIAVREQKSMLLSLYRQYIRQDGEATIEGFLGTGIKKAGFSPICRLDHLEYHLLVNRYVELFGKDKVLVLPFELLREQAGVRFEQAIHDFCGTGVTASETLAPKNVGWLGLTLAFRRRMNRFVHLPPQWNGVWSESPLSYRAGFKLCNLIDRIVPSRFHRAVDDRLKRYIAARATGYYAQSNRLLAESAGIDLLRLGYEM